jgi:hypothetical protein
MINKLSKCKQSVKKIKGHSKTNYVIFLASFIIQKKENTCTCFKMNRLKIITSGCRTNKKHILLEVPNVSNFYHFLYFK